MINDLLVFAALFFVGMFLGVFFFGGLWLTVQKCTLSRRPWLWFSISLVLRTGVIFVGFYLIAPGGLVWLVSSLTGFVAARGLVIVVTRSFPVLQEQKEVPHASER